VRKQEKEEMMETV